MLSDGIVMSYLSLSATKTIIYEVLGMFFAVPEEARMFASLFSRNCLFSDFTTKLLYDKYDSFPSDQSMIGMVSRFLFFKKFFKLSQSPTNFVPLKS